MINRIVALFRVIPIITITLIAVVFAEHNPKIPQETIPLYHWSYRVIDQLALRGCLRGLQLQNRPFTRYQISSAVSQAEIKPEDDTARELLQMLRTEFTTPIADRLHVGGFLGGDFKLDDDDFNLRWQMVSKFGYSFGSRVTIFNSMRLDQNLKDDPEYTGKYWRGFSGYTEQAYIVGNFRNFTLQFGRDYQVWGAGQSGHLLFSDNSQPFNLARLKIEIGDITFTSAAAQLDGYSVKADSSSLPGDGYYYDMIYHRRFFAAHRIDWRARNNLYLAVSEVVLYGGSNRTFEFEYLNPFIFYHGEQQNYKSEANTIVGADFLWFPGKKWKLYGEFMMDDIQFDKGTRAEQEPAEIGWIIGAAKVDPFGIKGLEIGFENAGITARTYNTLQPDQKFLHHDKPIAHPAGNDFILWLFKASKWFTPKIQVSLDFTYLRKGEDSIDAPFDTSFYAEDDYSEPFPTGTVEKKLIPALEVWYHHNRVWDLYFRGEYHYADNYENIKDATDKGFVIRLGARVDLDWNIDLQRK